MLSETCNFSSRMPASEQGCFVEEAVQAELETSSQAICWGFNEPGLQLWRLLGDVGSFLPATFGRRESWIIHPGPLLVLR